MSVRIGVIGVGFGSVVHIPAFQSEGLEVVAVCARNEARAEAAAKKFNIPHVFSDFQRMLEMSDLDAVSIVTPPALHHEMALAALNAGKHVLCEKPFALNSVQAREMWEASEASGLTAMICHEFRFAASRMQVKELIDEGYVGPLHMVVMNLANGPRGGFEARASSYRDDSDQGSGFLGALGSHYIDCLRHWFGEIETVSGHTFTHFPDRIKDDGDTIIHATAEDTFQFNLQFMNGGWATMLGTNAAPFGQGAKVEVYGRDGTLVTPHTGIGFNPPPQGGLLGAKPGDGTLNTIEVPERLRPFADDRDDRLMPFRLLVRQFIQGISDGASPAPNFYDGYKCQQILDAVRDSSSSGQTIRITE